jgi:hypothetical protein
MAYPEKYVGSKEYLLAYAEMIRAAQYRGVTTYQHIAAIVGLPPQGSHMGKEVGQLLGEISQAEERAGRPMLSAVVVSTEGSPGPGFYALARELGKLMAAGGAEDKEFWRKQLAMVHEEWRRPIVTVVKADPTSEVARASTART